MTMSTEDQRKVNDINGKQITIYDSHSYAVKEVKDGVITIINPHDSGKEIKLDMETFLDTFEDLTVTDLSKKEPPIAIRTEDATIEKIETERGYKEIIRRKENGELLSTKYYDNSGQCYNYELHER